MHSNISGFFRKNIFWIIIYLLIYISFNIYILNYSEESISNDILFSWFAYSSVSITILFRRLKSLLYLSKTKQRYPCDKCGKTNFQLSSKQENIEIEYKRKTINVPLNFLRCDSCNNEYPAFYTVKYHDRRFEYININNKKVYKVHPIYLYPINWGQIARRWTGNSMGTSFVASVFISTSLLSIAIKAYDLAVLSIGISIFPLLISYIKTNNEK